MAIAAGGIQSGAEGMICLGAALHWAFDFGHQFAWHGSEIDPASYPVAR